MQKIGPLTRCGTMGLGYFACDKVFFSLLKGEGGRGRFFSLLTDLLCYGNDGINILCVCQGISGAHLLELCDEDLQELGVDMATRRRTLLLAIAELKEEGYLVPKSFAGFKVTLFCVSVCTHLLLFNCIGEIFSRDSHSYCTICVVASSHIYHAIFYQSSSHVSSTVEISFP